MYDIYDLFAPMPEPLIPRPLRLEVDERIAADGQVVQPLDVRRDPGGGRAVRASKAESVAIAFLHSYLQPGARADDRGGHSGGAAGRDGLDLVRDRAGCRRVRADIDGRRRRLRQAVGAPLPDIADRCAR